MRNTDKMYNPYLPSDVYIPDGELRVFGNRVYVYGSQDLYGETNMCGGDYRCYSASPDSLGQWKDEGVIYTRMQDPYIREIVEHKKGNMFNQYLYAPDVIQVEDRYYLYYGVAMSGSGIACAVADQPTGPFEYVGRVRYPQEAKPQGWQGDGHGICDGDMVLGKGMAMIQPNPFRKHFGLNMADYPYDPAVLYDEGRVFLYFGCGHCYVTELDPGDMRTMIKSPETGSYYSQDLLPIQRDKAVHELQDGWHMGNGSSIRKIGDLYYLSYYAVNQHHGNAMCYSTSKSPFGPFTYQGVLVSLGNGRYEKQLEPTFYVGNTHGGMACINGIWYQNYHRHTGYKYPCRQACLTQLVMTEDGRFLQAEYKSQIFEKGGLPVNHRYPADIICECLNRKGKTGNRRNTPYFMLEQINDQKLQVVAGLYHSSSVGVKYLDFGDPQVQQESPEASKASCSVQLLNPDDGQIEVYIDRISDANKIVEISTKAQSGLCSFTGNLDVAVSGVHEVWFRFCNQSRETRFTEFIIT